MAVAVGNTTYFNGKSTEFAAPAFNLETVGDLNGDGFADLIVHSPTAFGQPGPLRIALGNGQGGFTEQALFAAGSPVVRDPHILVADFTGDGRTDIAVFDAGYYDWSVRTTKGGTPVLYTQGADGRFTATTALTDPLAPLVQPMTLPYKGGYQVDLTMGVKDVAMADIDSDGDVDIWLESTGSANIPGHFLINNGGTFTVDLNHRLGDAAYLGKQESSGNYYRYGSAKFVDINGDGRPDLLLGQIRDNDITHIGQSSYVAVNSGGGQYPGAGMIKLPLPDFYFGYTSVQDAASWDINGDGRNDLVLVHTRNDDVSGTAVETAWTGTFVQVLVQTAQGGFVDETAQRIGDQSAWSGTQMQQGSHAIRVDALDVNQDGSLDIVLGYASGVRPSGMNPQVLLAKQGGTFAVASNDWLTAGDPYFGEGLVAGDIDGDGRVDFLHVDSGPGANGSYDGLGTDDISIVVAQLAKSPFGGRANQIVPSFEGGRADYDLSHTSGGVQVRAAGGAVETFAGRDRIAFADMSVNMAIGEVVGSASAAGVNSVIELYIAYLNRVPDADGMAYWIGELKAGRTLDQIGDAFYGAAVYFGDLTGYRSDTTNEEFVTTVYRNVLGRQTVDADGMAYWSSALASGAQTRGSLVSAILGSAHTFKGDATYGWVADLLDNKIEVGRLFALEKGLVYNTGEASIVNGMAIAAAITPTSTAQAVALIGVDDGFSVLV